MCGLHYPGFWIMDNPLLSSFKFGAPEYAAMITLFTGIFLILNYTCIKSMLPSERFYDLQNEIHWLIIYDDMSMSHQGDFKSNYIKGTSINSAQ